jgi:hypothetical protein
MDALLAYFQYAHRIFSREKEYISLTPLRKTDRQAGKQVGIQTDRQKETDRRQSEKQKDRQT